MQKNELIEFINNNYNDCDFKNMAELIKKDITCELDASGIMYRIFTRVKTKDSTINKICAKYDKYTELKTKMQDIIGMRIVLYFKDDIGICIKILSELFREKNHELDNVDTTTFRPIRTNFVFEIPKNINSIPSKYNYLNIIDDSFEVQIRTVFSEGWYEVEHDIRYKNNNDWNGEEEMARDMNGLLAVLELCDNNLIGICDNLAYNKYKECNIGAMIRNRFRIRLSNNKINASLERVIKGKNKEFGKQIFRFDRELLITILCRCKIKRTIDNIIFIINYVKIKDDEITALCGEEITNKLGSIDVEGIRKDSKNVYNSIVAMKY